MRSNPLTHQVRRAYSQDTLRRILTLREDRFGRAFGMQTVTVEPRYSYRDSERSEDYYHFKDNESRVLAVAHLDTVVPGNRRNPHFTATRRGPHVVSGALDDRLGAYVILDLLPKAGVNCDWLFTVGEESGQSTAAYFKPEKDYDWVIEFDRTGTDVVMYQYEDRASRRLVEAAGAQMGSGSFSDIAYLEHMGVKAFNWGVGYRGSYHSAAGYAYLNDTFGMVAKYMRFHEQNAGLTMTHDADDYDYRYRRTGSGKWWDDADEKDDCYTCGQRKVDLTTGYCQGCGACMDCGGTNPDIAAEWDDPDVDVCQCYAPKSRAKDWDPENRDYHDEVTGLRGGYTRDDNGDWRQMTFAEYLAQRPDAKVTEADEVNHAACIMAGPEVLDSHEHAGQDGLWTPARRYTYDCDSLNRHEAAEGLDGLHVVAHKPSYDRASVCKRCAARWPTAAGSVTTPPRQPEGTVAADGAAERAGTQKTALAILTERLREARSEPAGHQS